MHRNMLQLISKSYRIKPSLANVQNMTLLSCRHNHTYINNIKPEITAVIEQYGDKALSARVDEILRYNQPPENSPMAYFLDASEAFLQLARKEDITEENVRLAKILNWCLKTIELTYVILDDYMDGDSIRYGKPCWYVKDGVGSEVINDALLIEQIAFYVLRKVFGELDIYSDLFDMFAEMKFTTFLGQSLDIRSPTIGIDNFDFNYVNAIADYKTAICSVHVPLACGMYLAGIKDTNLHQQLKGVTFQFGRLFQLQNDYLDCYGGMKEMGKVSADIKEGRCTWFSAKCVQKCSPAQLDHFKACYGSTDNQKILQVKKLYDELRLPEEYENYRLAMVSSIRNLIQNLEHRKLSIYLTILVNSLYTENRLFVPEHSNTHGTTITSK